MMNRILSILSIFMPLLVILFCTSPFLGQLFPTYVIHKYLTFSRLSYQAINSIQWIAVASVAVLRLFLTRAYVQSYLFSGVTQALKVIDRYEESQRQKAMINMVFTAIEEHTKHQIVIVLFEACSNCNSTINFNTNMLMCILHVNESKGLYYINKNFNFVVKGKFISDIFLDGIDSVPEYQYLPFFFGQTFLFLSWWTCLTIFVLSIVDWIYFVKEGDNA